MLTQVMEVCVVLVQSYPELGQLRRQCNKSLANHPAEVAKLFLFPYKEYKCATNAALQSWLLQGQKNRSIFCQDLNWSDTRQLD